MFTLSSEVISVVTHLSQWLHKQWKNYCRSPPLSLSHARTHARAHTHTNDTGNQHGTCHNDDSKNFIKCFSTFILADLSDMGNSLTMSYCWPSILWIIHQWLFISFRPLTICTLQNDLQPYSCRLPWSCHTFVRKPFAVIHKT
jgi:hypothetical protein